MKRSLSILILSCFVWGSGLLATASACPMCKTANETENAQPRAYMYSIFFMMSMPAMIFTGFGIGVYRLTKERDAELEQDDSSTKA